MSLLTGAFEVGDVVNITYYQPTEPHWHSTLAERMEHGSVYRRYEGVQLTGVWPLEFCTMHCEEVGECPHAGTGISFAARIPGDHSEFPYTLGDTTWALLEYSDDPEALW